MIGRIIGTVALLHKDTLIVDVSGIGYSVHASASVLKKASVGLPVTLWTHLVVRETVLELFGFSSHEELQFFDQIIGVSGVGPRSGIAILSLAPIDTLRSAIAKGDAAYLTKVSGIGKKTAEKIVLELKDKVTPSEEGLAAREEDAEVLDALEALGYGLREAREALKEIPESAEGTSERVREALKMLGRSA